MAVDQSYLQYPWRRPGMDHDRYDYSNLFARRKVEWPGGARVALVIMPTLQFFPLDMETKPFMAPGGMERAYPDYWNYTLRDYGTRVGCYRIFEALAERKLKASVPMNSRVAERHPFLTDYVNRQGFEILAHGIDMGRLHHSGLAIEDERAQVRESVETLRRLSGQPVKGWMSPAQSQSANTSDLLTEFGIEYACDWGNDDLPYAMRTRGGPLYAFPNAIEIADLRLLHTYKHRADEFTVELMDHFRLLYREAAKHGGRIVTLTLTPWWTGVPHRIGALERALDQMLDHAGVWSATAGEVVAAFKEQEAAA